tara:strand:+ start:48 stop:497 length:450 start_codon:yes stop_codon:yes gene_type:complete
MKRLFLISALLFSFNGYSNEITEEVAIAKLHEFFFLLDVDNYEKENFSKIVAKDFQIFEVGNNFDLDSFDQFINDATGDIVETDWTLSDFEVTLDDHSAHISYYNKGVFKTQDNESIYSDWMESVYMILEDRELKIKFLQSDLINREIK